MDLQMEMSASRPFDIIFDGKEVVCQKEYHELLMTLFYICRTIWVLCTWHPKPCKTRWLLVQHQNPVNTSQPLMLYYIVLSLSLSPCMYYELYIYIYLHVKIYYYHMYIYSTYNRPHARASTMTTPSIQVTWTEPVGVQTSEFEQNTLGTWWKLCGRGAENQPPMCCTYFPPQTIQLKKPEHHSFKWKGTIIWSKSFRTFAVNNANFTVLPLDTGFRKENMVNFMAGTFNARLPWNRAHLSWVPAFIARELRGRRWNN